MTYCVAMRLDEGIVFLSDSRTNAGVDHVSTFRKMTVFERPGDRTMVVMTAGNLAISQAVRQWLQERSTEDGLTVWTARTMFDAVRVVGDAVRAVHERDADQLKKFGVDFNCAFIFGGQIKGEPPRLFQIYAAGNFIEATPENPYFQIGEAKYGKPIIDRIINPSTPLDEAAKCALISMDSTLRSNISVGLPLDLLVYEANALRVTRFVQIDNDNHYFQMIHNTWGKRLQQVFGEIPDPTWGETGSRFAHPDYRLGQKHADGHADREPQHQPPRAPLPAALAEEAAVLAEERIQTVAAGGLPRQAQ
ncbi:proteasome-type protease [Derxia lacustris]|uniref:proteasome-type protease n=1 Tax=Derxia lacustris TaxID=764842 RepID=UPI00111BDAF0|nr:proteasome-type protease [Derxia lacustris]